MPGAETREPDLHAFVLPRERALAKLRAGRPLLHDEPIVLDLEFASDLFLRLAAERSMDVGAVDISAVLTEAFVQHADHVHQLASVPGLDADVTAELAGQAIAPLLHAYAGKLAPLVRNVGGWQRGYCPICGCSRGEDGFIQCRACGCAWRAAAPEPPFRIELALPADEDA